ncbi:MAG: metalloprotease [Flavobacteriaceae bacterium]
MKRIISLFLSLTAFACSSVLMAQHDIVIVAELDTKEHILQMQQKITFNNTSETTLDTIYFLDWAHSFSSKTTPLAKRFSENFQSNFHFEKDEVRGKTILHSVSDENYTALKWQRGNEDDILKAIPARPIAPGESYTFNFVYEVKLPDSKFTRYGHLDNGNYNLKHWFISPAVFNDGWHVYSNKNLDDFYINPSHFKIQIKTPAHYHLTSDLNVLDTQLQNGFKTHLLQGEYRNAATIYLQEDNIFETIITDDLEVYTSIDDKGLYPPLKAIQVDRIVKFLEKELGPYPFEKMVISDEDYKQNPAWGLNQLPNFIRPFPDGFQFDIEQLKTITGNYIKNTLNVNPRDAHWFQTGLQIYLMMKYTESYYPDMKIVGNLSKVIGVRWFHGSQLDFNDQYSLLYMNSARLNLDQPPSTPKDSLIKFNAQIASGYKTGVGLHYFNNYLNDDVVSESIKEFYSASLLKPTDVTVFREIVSSNANKDTDWFFDQYIGSNKKIDYKIKKIEEAGDSLEITIKNKSENTMPFTLYGMHKKNVISKQWEKGFESTKTITIPAYGIDRVAIDYEQNIPEFNKRNNYRKVKGLFKKPVQVRLLLDVEDPEYHQLFVMPVFEYNLYDGLTMGPRMYNKTVLAKNFIFKIDPLYGFTSKAMVGGASLSYLHHFENKKLSFLRFGTSYSRNSYNEDLFYNRLNLNSTIAFREKNLRSNKRHFINMRNVLVKRDINLDVVNPEEPNYNVFNAQYVYSNANLINHFRATFDYEISDKFQKAHTTLEYRKLFLNNRQIDLRLFGGVFLDNSEPTTSNYFSYALDRPTDYLFDYNYYGRSEDTGLFSQQIILAEGGFKSKLEPAFANRWIITLNASTNIWKWIHAYGDVGMLHNNPGGTKAVFDTGIRANLVTDYFELYFPLYSSNGWEPGQDRYDQKVRFIVTLSPETLLRLFTRRWY